MYRKELFEELQKIINIYLKGGKKRNLEELSRLSHINSTTLRRALYGEKLPDHMNLLKLICTLSLETNVSVIIEKAPPILSEHLKFHFKSIYERGKTEIIYDTLDSLDDPDSFIVYCLALNEGGIHKEKVFKRLGERSVYRIEELKHRALIEEDKHGNLKAVQLTEPMPLDHLKRQVANFSKLYDPYKEHNHLHLETASVNKETYRKLIQAHKDFQRLIKETMENKKNKGAYTFFSIGVADTILKHEQFD